jgi:hypothetical protein
MVVTRESLGITTSGKQGLLPIRLNRTLCRQIAGFRISHRQTSAPLAAMSNMPSAAQLPNSGMATMLILTPVSGIPVLLATLAVRKRASESTVRAQRRSEWVRTRRETRSRRTSRCPSDRERALGSRGIGGDRYPDDVLYVPVAPRPSVTRTVTGMSRTGWIPADESAGADIHPGGDTESA